MIDCRYHLSFGVIGSIAAAVVGKVRILGDSTEFLGPKNGRQWLA